MEFARAYSPFEPLTEDALLSLGSMEGLAEPVRAVKPVWSALLPGYVLAVAVSAVAFAIHYLPYPPFLTGARRPISASILAIVLAIAIRNLLTVPKASIAGCKHIVRNAIPAAIVLAGAGLNLSQAAGAGWQSFAIVAASMAVAMCASVLLGRWLGVSQRTALLIGTGTAVCGTSAIVAAAPLLEAEDEDLTLSVGTVSLLGLILMFALPVAGGLLGLDQRAFGVWAGTTIHAVPQVVAAGFTFGPDAGSLATLVKLGRVALLAPFLLVLTLFLQADRGRIAYSKLVPTFLWGFLAFAVCNTLGLIPGLVFKPAGLSTITVALGPWLTEAGNWLLTLAMAAIGLEVNLRLLARVGLRAVAAGFGAMVLLCAASLAMIRLLL